MKLKFPKTVLPSFQLKQAKKGAIIGFTRINDALQSAAIDYKNGELYLTASLEKQKDFVTIVRLSGKFEFIQRHYSSMVYETKFDSIESKFDLSCIDTNNNQSFIKSFEELQPGDCFIICKTLPDELVNRQEDSYMIVTNPVNDNKTIGYMMNLSNFSISEIDKNALVYSLADIELSLLPNKVIEKD